MDIDIIIPVFNGEKHIITCLDSIKNQDYPEHKIHIYIVDDKSDDNTVRIAESYGCKILTSGARHIEKSKSIGIKSSKSELVLLMDIDNYFPEKNWISTAVSLLNKHPEAVAVESAFFNYERKDPPANRYCSLFGINDPIAFYLKKRDKFMQTESAWNLTGTAKDMGEYFLAEFSPSTMPTVGSQGFLIRRKLMKHCHTEPYFFHIEANMEISAAGYGTYIFMKNSAGHNHVASSAEFLKKCRRNITLYYKFSHLRKFNWKQNKIIFFITILSMVTLLRPLADSVKNFFKKPDSAWFLHPYFCFMVPAIYTIETLKHLFAERK